jgi:hypothetical protein
MGSIALHESLSLLFSSKEIDASHLNIVADNAALPSNKLLREMNRKQAFEESFLLGESQIDMSCRSLDILSGEVDEDCDGSNEFEQELKAYEKDTSEWEMPLEKSFSSFRAIDLPAVYKDFRPTHELPELPEPKISVPRSA